MTRERNFMYNLWHQNKISKSIFSVHIPTNTTQENVAKIMFGGWDPDAQLSQNDTVQVVNTVGFNSWELRLHDKINLNGRDLELFETTAFNNTAIIDTSYPYIFIPNAYYDLMEADFNKIINEALFKVMPDIKLKYDICGPDVALSRRHRCKIPVSCSELKENGFELNLTL